MYGDEYNSDTRWFDPEEHPEGSVYEGVKKTIESIDTAQREHDESFDRYLRFYSRKVANRYKGNKFVTDFDDDRIAWNVIKQCVEATTALISTHRVRPYFSTFGASYKKKRKAEKLNRFVHGLFTRKKIYEKMTLGFKHAAIFGTGCIHVFEDKDGTDVGIEVVYPGEVIVDNEESRDGEARSIYRHKVVHRTVLQAILDNAGISKFSAHDCTILRNDYGQAYRNSKEQVSLIEAWHLPSGEGSGDGRHVIICSEGDILDEEWTRQTFPLKFFHYQTPPRGFWGVGITESLVGIQAEINYILSKIQKLMTLMTTMWWVQKGSGVSKISNYDAAVREYQGRPPLHMAPPSISAEYFSHLDRLRASAFEEVGISQLQATGLKPAGLNSGASQREYKNTVSARFRHTQQGYEAWALEIAEGILDVARDIAEKGESGIRAICQGDKYCEEINFKDCDLDEDQYVMRLYPTGFLPEEPAARTEKIMELIQMNPQMQRFATLALTGVPDVESLVGPINAPIEIVQKHLAMLLDGESVIPLPMQDLGLTVLMCTNAILEAETDGTPESALDRMRVYLAKAEEMLRLSQPAPAPAGGPGIATGVPETPLAPPIQ